MELMDTTWREELAWAAGFFDGEGSTSLLRGKYGRLSIHQVDRRPLDRFRIALLDIGAVRGPYPHRDWQPIHHWRADGFENVQAALMLLWPFLGEPKREQARPVLETMNFAPPTWTDGSLDDRTCRRGHSAAKHRTKAGQCRKCMRLTDARRKGYFTDDWYAKWLAED